MPGPALWPGKVLNTTQTICLDFGTSPDFAQATSFIVGMSRPRILTPDSWQK